MVGLIVVLLAGLVIVVAIVAMEIAKANKAISPIANSTIVRILSSF